MEEACLFHKLLIKYSEILRDSLKIKRNNKMFVASNQNDHIPMCNHSKIYEFMELKGL